MNSADLDTRCRVETPEGIEFDSSLAGPVPRALAYVVDFLWRTLVYFIVSIVTRFFGEFGFGVFLITFFLLEWFYPVYFEVFRGGQTPGKKAYKIRVVNDDFTPITFANSCIRNLLRFADFLPAFYLFGLTSMVLNRKFQRMGDLAAGTLVIHVAKEGSHSVPEGLKPKPASILLTPEEQRALADFVLRSDEISSARQLELAEILSPILEKDSASSLEEIRSIGAWLLGAK